MENRPHWSLGVERKRNWGERFMLRGGRPRSFTEHANGKAPFYLLLKDGSVSVWIGAQRRREGNFLGGQVEWSCLSVHIA